MPVIKRFVHIVGRVWQGVGITALVLIVVWAAWRIPTERREARVLYEKVNLNDGPHVFWLDEFRARVITIRYDRPKRDFAISEEILDLNEEPPSRPGIAKELDLTAGPPGKLASDTAVFHANRIAAVSDIHGQYNHFVALLKNGRIIDQHLDWNWGEHHLVIAGDVFDKGPGVTELLWLIRKLERQAERAGGRVHFLLGNHDYLALKGNSNFIHSKYRETAPRLFVPFENLFGPDTELGRWLRTKNVIVKINDRLFVHAGLPETVVQKELPLEEINRLARFDLNPDRLLALSQEERRTCREICGTRGLLWYRGYFEGASPLAFVRRLRGDLRESESARTTVDKVLQVYGCKQIVVGHTYTRSIKPLFGGKVIAICLALAGDDILDEDSRAEMLEIEGDQLYRVSLDGQRDQLQRPPA